MSSDIEMWPPPNDATAFESLCLDVWKGIWNDPSAQKNGRSGQPQAGVDVFGKMQGKQIGVQCKQKDGLLRTELTVDELAQEVERAKNFRPPLERFIIATTGPRDASVQERARVLTNEHKAKGLFSIEVWSWKDIWHELYQREELLNRIGPIYWHHSYRFSATATSSQGRRNKAMLAVSFLSIVLLALGLMLFLHKSQSAFSIIPREQYINTQNTRYYCLWSPNGIRTLSPIHVRLFVEFTNLKDRSITVNSYQFEGQTSEGKWELMPTVDVKHGRMVWRVSTNVSPDNAFPDIQSPNGVTLTYEIADDLLFPYAITGKTIAPGAKIDGYLLLEAPPAGFSGTMRCRMRDSTDTEFLQLVKPAQETNSLNEFVQSRIGAQIFRWDEDITKARRVRYSEALK